VSAAIEIKNKQLGEAYNIEAEAIDLLDLVQAKEQKKAEFQKELEVEEERIKTENERRQKQAEREKEEYEYRLKFERKKEDDEAEFRSQIKEREFNEKLLAREKELLQRELKIKEQENEFLALKNRVDGLVDEIERAKKEAAGQTKSEMEKQFKIEKDLLVLEQGKEKEMAKLKIAGLEDTVKKQISQIQTIQTQLETASKKAQELAIKIIESGRKEEEPKPHELQTKDE